MIDEYKDAHFRLFDESYDLTPCYVRNSCALERFGWCGKGELMKFNGGMLYPSDYFCPKEFSSYIKRYTDNTVSIHHYYGW